MHNENSYTMNVETAKLAQTLLCRVSLKDSTSETLKRHFLTDGALKVLHMNYLMMIRILSSYVHYLHRDNEI